MLLTRQELSRMAPVQPGQKPPDRLGRLASHMVRVRVRVGVRVRVRVRVRVSDRLGRLASHMVLQP